jgi:hypothetical protein
MRILVIDDSMWNRVSAEETLREHLQDLTVEGDMKKLLELFGSGWKMGPSPDLPDGRLTVGWYDVVLTDLWLPSPEVELSAGGGYINRCPFRPKEDPLYNPKALVPAGLVFALAARNAGVRHVGILTDVDHHRDHMTLLCDSLSQNSKDPQALPPVRMYEARYHHLRDVLWDKVEGKRVQEHRTRENYDELRHSDRYAYIKDWGSALDRLLKGKDW